MNDPLTVTMKEPHGSVESAQRLVDPFLRAWELDMAPRHGEQEIRFEVRGGPARVWGG